MRAILLLFMLSATCWADVIVLKNGKKMLFEGKYEVVGNSVTFKDKSGESVRLPLAVVDLEKSAAATLAYQNEREARQAAREAEPPAPKKVTTMAEIAEQMENARPKDAPKPKPISIDQSKLKSYADASKRVVNDAVAESGSEGRSADEIQQSRADISARKNDLQKQLDELNQKIALTEKARDSMANASAYDSGTTGESYEQMEIAEKNLKELQAKRDELQKQMGSIDSEMRGTGVGPRAKAQKQSDDEDNQGIGIEGRNMADLPEVQGSDGD